MAGATKTGSEYVALTNLSMPRVGRKADDPNDLIPAFGTVILTDEQAAPFLNRRPPVIMPLKDANAAGSIPRIPPSALAGRMFRPPQPAQDSPDPRPDPEGSSHLVVFDDPRVPEMHEPQIDSETRPSGGAIDIPPSGGGQAAAQQLAAQARRASRG